MFVGADLEALVREVKALVVDELTKNRVSGTGGDGSEGQIRVTMQHFNTVLEKIRGSLDSADFERYEQKSWNLLYGKQKREILFQAANLINQVEYLKRKGDIPREIEKRSDDLKTQVYWTKKSFDSIQDGVTRLRRSLSDLSGERSPR
jgi:transitional endoplasmic reticulum ATPase